MTKTLIFSILNKTQRKTLPLCLWTRRGLGLHMAQSGTIRGV